MNERDLALIAAKLPLSKSTLKANACCGPSSAEPQPPVCHRPVGPQAREDSHPTRYAIRVVSFRRRLLDPDNLVAKYYVDALRYAGIISNDRARDIDYSISQEKVEKDMPEATIITIEQL